MLAYERHEAIISRLREKGTIKIQEIAREFGVSNETARRDLDALQEAGLVSRIHGGGVLNEVRKLDHPLYRTRVESNNKKKAAIGKKAVELIRPGDSLFLGVGTTVLELVRNLSSSLDLTVVTGSLFSMLELAERGISVIAVGGKIDTEEFCMYGGHAHEAMRKYYVNKVIIGAGGITIDGGVTDYGGDDYDYSFLFKRAKEVIVLADSDKFGTDAFVSLCPLKYVNTIVTDSGLDPDVIKQYVDLGIRVITAEA